MTTTQYNARYTVTLETVSPIGTRRHVYRGKNARQLADYWMAYWKAAGYEVREV